jgi:hypothetical protein
MTKTTAMMMATLVAGALGCSSGDDEELAQARQLWATKKQTCATYHYEVGDSSFSGWRAATTIAITDGQPSERSYSAGAPSAVDGTFTVTTTWTESDAEVGTHEVGRAARTMDQLYDDCSRDVLTKDRAKNLVTFQADQQGVLEQCWYFPKDCADDCSSGVVVSNFACGALPRAP